MPVLLSEARVPIKDQNPGKNIFGLASMEESEVLATQVLLTSKRARLHSSDAEESSILIHIEFNQISILIFLICFSGVPQKCKS